LFKFAPFNNESRVERLTEQDIERFPEKIFVLGTSDLHNIFHLRPHLILGTEYNAKSKDLVCVITHERNFDDPVGEPN